MHTAYLDDVYALVSRERVQAVYTLLAHHLHRHAHIQLNSGKTRIWDQAGQTTPRPHQLPAGNLGWPPPTATRTARLHGPGRATGLTRVCPTPTPPHIGRLPLSQHLPHLHDLQASWPLLLHTASPRGNDLLRFLPPRVTQPFAQDTTMQPSPRAWHNSWTTQT